MVWEAIADEIGAVAMYAQMANMVNNVELKTMIGPWLFPPLP
ncbi:hypothetical protein [Syntrophomonas wolfei]|jgi:NTP pyrophosphatase (non-canonical NTP hydrolase)|nr:hypothetical protein [Syntrophomonas wolfei]